MHYFHGDGDGKNPPPGVLPVWEGDNCTDRVRKAAAPVQARASTDGKCLVVGCIPCVVEGAMPHVPVYCFFFLIALDHFVKPLQFVGSG